MKIGAGDLLKVLTFLGQKPLKSEVALIIWVSYLRKNIKLILNKHSNPVFVSVGS